MIKKIKTISIFPWYIFLLPVFYILHANNAYFWLIPPSLSLRYLFDYLLLASASFAIGRLLLRHNIKAGIWSVSLLIIFFFFGITYDFLKGLSVPSFLTSYTFLLSLIVVILLLIMVILRKKQVPLKLHSFFLLLFSLLALSEAGLFMFNIISGKKEKENFAVNNKLPSIKLSAPDPQKEPDIFFIVFDEYTSSLALEKYFHFDNHVLDSSLLKHGFYISTKSQSNYNSTPVSIGSCFNMDYYQRNLEKTSLNLLQGAYTLKESYLPKLLEEHGYQVINYGVFDLENHPATVTPIFEEFMKMPLYIETLWGRIRRDILWNITVRLPGYKKAMPANQAEIDRNRKNFSSFIGELGRETDKPRFVIGHLILPRRPANVDRYGHPRTRLEDDLTDHNHDSLYLEQLQYANTLIDSIACTAEKNRSRPLALIIEGDHGNRYAAWGVHIREKQFMNLNSFYFSDRNYSMLYDSISPVNSFRIILNKYFDARLPILKDSTVLVH